jgi:hypothetical protein
VSTLLIPFASFVVNKINIVYLHLTTYLKKFEKKIAGKLILCKCSVITLTDEVMNILQGGGYTSAGGGSCHPCSMGCILGCLSGNSFG